MLVHIREIIRKAKNGGYAVGAFNIHNLETLTGIVQAAKAKKSPAIIQVSESTIEYLGLMPVVHLVSDVVESVAKDIPIALHLDHGKSLESIVKCVDAGFSSVHMDGSSLPLEENINITKKAIDYAHARGVWVQGEVGPIMGGHGDSGKKLDFIPLAKLEEVLLFVKMVEVDTIAAAIGTAHGVYKNETINFGLLKKIKEKIKVPFVLHGASGIEDAKIRKAVKMGVNIINIGTDIKVAFSKNLIKNCIKNKKETDPRHLLKPTIAAVQKVVEKKVEVLGSGYFKS